MSSLSSPATSGFQFKGGLFPLTSIQLLDPTLEGFSEQLAKKIQQAPKFFSFAPMVIDLQKIQEHQQPVNFKALKTLLEANDLVPVGVRGGSPKQHEQAIQAGFASFPEQKKEAPSSATDKAEDVQKSESTHPRTKIIKQPVRSGQQIYAQGGDLIVIAPVSHGAELLADGNIHIYSTLRGRALAGVNGDTQAKIFCHSLEAELVSVAGHYQTSEDLNKSTYWKKSVTIGLTDNQLDIIERT